MAYCYPPRYPNYPPPPPCGPLPPPPCIPLVRCYTGPIGPTGPAGGGGSGLIASGYLWRDLQDTLYIAPGTVSGTGTEKMLFNQAGPMIGGIQPHVNPNAIIPNNISFTGSLGLFPLIIPGTELYTGPQYDGFILPTNGIYEVTYTVSNCWPWFDVVSENYNLYGYIFGISSQPNSYPYSVFIANNGYQVYTDPSSTLSVRLLDNNVTIPGSIKSIYNETPMSFYEQGRRTAGYWLEFPEVSHTVQFQGNANDVIQLGNNNGIDGIFSFNALPYVNSINTPNDNVVTGNLVNTLTINYGPRLTPPNPYSYYVCIEMEYSNSVPSLTVQDDLGNNYILAASQQGSGSLAGYYNYIYYYDYQVDINNNTTTLPASVTITIPNGNVNLVGMAASSLILINTSVGSLDEVSTGSTGIGPIINDSMNTSDINNIIITSGVAKDNTFFTPNNPYTGIIEQAPVNIFLSGFASITYPIGTINQTASILEVSGNTFNWMAISVSVKVGYYPLFVSNPILSSMSIKLLSTV